MTTYLNNYENYRYQTNYADFYNGVVRVSTTESYGTGALLYDGKSILTAAHVFEGFNRNNIIVYFDTSWGTKAYNATVNIYDYYDPSNSNGDLAILTLEKAPSSLYERYDIYRDSFEIGSNFTMVGYGAYGSGQTGRAENQDEILKLKTSNTFDSDFYSIYASSNTNLLWKPLKNSILAADFDSGYRINDALGNILNINHLGLGYFEGMIASGDSGGPAFINNLIAGVASYTSSISTKYFESDINDTIDSSFGEIGAWQRVSYYSEWIDKTIRASYKNAPTSKTEVQKYVLEKDEDYIFTSGIITLYKDESSVVIPVEIIGDNKPEQNETFYLDITNPSHGSLGEDSMLTAMRTIINDDYYIA